MKLNRGLGVAIIAGTAFVSSGLSVLVVLAVTEASSSLALGLLGGLGGAILGVGFLVFSSERGDKIRAFRPEELVIKFSQLEGKVRTLASTTLGQYTDSLSLASMVTALEKYGYWSEDKSDTFRQILRIRNSIIHESRTPSVVALNNAIQAIDEMQKDLPRIETPRGDARIGILENAVQTFRHLAGDAPDRYRPDLAGSLSNLGVTYSELGRLADALPVTEEAVAINRELAAANPDRYRPNLAQSLTDLNDAYSDLNRPIEALQVSEEVLAIRRELAAANPGRYRPDLARSLSNLGMAYWDLNRPIEALQVSEEALAIRRELAAANPGRYRPDLARSLSNLKVVLSNLGRDPEAQAVDEELRRLVKDLDSE